MADLSEIGAFEVKEIKVKKGKTQVKYRLL